MQAKPRAARLRGWRAEDAGALALELDAGSAQLAIAEDGAVRLRASAGAALPPDPAPAVGREPWRPSRAEAEAGEGSGVRIVHEGPKGSAFVEVDAEPFAVRVRERGGELVAELRDLHLTEDGRARIAVTALPGERFFGFGEKRGGLDKRGERLRMRNRDPELDRADPLYVSIPFFVSLRHGPDGARSRGVLLDSHAPSRVDVAAGVEDRVVLETDAGGLDLTLFPGPLPEHVLRRFAARVGSSPLPPVWALGHHQSRWSYGSEDEVREIAAELRTRRIPTDAIHLDIDYMDGFRVFTWNPKRFPNPKQLLGDLAEQGFRVVTIVDPGVKADPDYAVYREGVERDAFCKGEDGRVFTLKVWPKDAALPDFNRPEVRRWWGERHAPLLDAGVAGIWNDMNEPAGWKSELRIGRLAVPTRRQDLSQMTQSDPAEPRRRVPHEAVRNLYGHQQCRATRAHLESANPRRRPFVLSRAGCAGSGHFAAIWTGDNRSRWSDLRESIPMLLNLSLSGVPFCGADIGGFFLSCTPELYARWIQLGAFYPFARTHSMWAKRRQEPWRFGRRVEAIARAALELRMSLIPYLYGLFHEAERSGAPIWRPLFYEFPEDPAAAAVEDELMVGPSLLLAPVLERGARARDLYLPPGDWMGWHDDARLRGPRRIRVAAALEQLPLFVRCGSILPTRSPVQHAGETPEEPLVLRVFPGADGRGELVEDDGETTAYREGAVARTGLHLRNRAGGRLRIELGVREGGFQVPERSARVVVHGYPAPERVLLDGKRLAQRRAVPGYELAEGRVHVGFVERGRGHTLELEPEP
jgi:alpha-glucosidase